MTIEWIIIAILAAWLIGIWAVLVIWTHTGGLKNDDVTVLVLLAPFLLLMTIASLCRQVLSRAFAPQKGKLK